MSQTAKVFRSGNSQAVRLPKEFRFDVDEVEISREGDAVILRPHAKAGVPRRPLLRVWERGGFSDDFMAEGREQPAAEERPGLGSFLK